MERTRSGLLTAGRFEMRGNVQRGESWTISVPAGMLPPPSDGKYYYGINFATEKQDEWLI